MSFFNSSPNFITQRLKVDFKGLNPEQSIAKYEELKVKTREKLREYYPKAEDKVAFYQEVIELLGTRDGDYILLNLFFETDVDTIVRKLKENNILNSVKCRDIDSLSHKLLSEINKNSNFQIVPFLKEHFTSLIDLSETDWTNENQNVHPLVRAFAKWLTDNLSHGKNEFVLGIFLFDKIWNIFFTNPFNNQKALVFITVLIEETKKSSSVSIHQYFDEVKTIASELFIDRPYSILVDGIDFKIELSQGYQKKRLEFEKFLDDSRSKDKSFLSLPYQEIFKAFPGLNEPDREKAIKDIKSKIDSGEIPIESDMILLSSIEASNKLVSLVNQKCYFFENIEY
jgi:hypothetical protein